MHRVPEEIRTNFQDINKLISSVKKVFLIIINYNNILFLKV